MRSGLQELLTGILRAGEQRAKPLFDRARTGRTRLAGVGGRDKQRAGRDDGQCGDGDTLPRYPPVSFLPPGPSGRHSTQRLDTPVVCVLPWGERDDEQTASYKAHELLVRQMRERDRELPVGPYGHARDGSAVVRRRELCHARRGRWRILVECKFVLGVVVAPCSGGGCEDSVLALSLDFCLGEDSTTNQQG
jgi:hypothetical protein